jgi:LCP family protein required for cell wall assembly
MAWTAGLVALLLVGLSGTAYAMMRHFNNNIHQVNVTALTGTQQSSEATGENVLVIGSGTPLYAGNQYDHLRTDLTHTLMLLHIQADGKWAEIMSVPSNSWVHIPSCLMGNGGLARPVQGPIGQAFATGNAYGNTTALGVDCLVKTFENNTGISVNHFILINFYGLGAAVAALHGIRVCIPYAFTDPMTGAHFAAGCQWLTPGQAVDYAQAVYGINPANTALLTSRQQGLAAALISRARGELYDPLAIYKFVDAVTKSLTIDTKLGGFTGVVTLADRVHSIPSSDITFFTVPYYPRSVVVPTDKENVLWKQPQADRIFFCIREDIRVSPSGHC